MGLRLEAEQSTGPVSQDRQVLAWLKIVQSQQMGLAVQ